MVLFNMVIAVFGLESFSVYDMASTKEIREDISYMDEMKIEFAPNDMQPFKCSEREVVFSSNKTLIFAYTKDGIFA